MSDITFDSALADVSRKAMFYGYQPTAEEMAGIEAELAQTADDPRLNFTDEQIKMIGKAIDDAFAEGQKSVFGVLSEAFLANRPVDDGSEFYKGFAAGEARAQDAVMSLVLAKLLGVIGRLAGGLPQGDNSTAEGAESGV